MNGSTVRSSKMKLVLILVVGSVTLFLLFILSLVVGSVDMSFTDAMGALWGYITKLGDVSRLTPDEKIVGLLRLPRAVAVVGVGIALSVAGAVMQALIRNPLVDPYITGVSSGAAAGAAVVMLMGITVTGIGLFAVPVAAFIGAIGAFFFTLLLAEASGGRALNYVLAGIVTGTALSSLTSLIMTVSGNQLHGIVFWMFGSFATITTDKALLIIVPTIFLCLIVLVMARELNVILLGHEQAWQLGVDSRSFKRLMMVLTSILTSIAVAFTGIIGFLGLIVPHIGRILVGGDHRLLLPASMILGANVLLVADLVSRTAMQGELPVGAIISLIGAPFFGYLLVRRGRDYAG